MAREYIEKIDKLNEGREKLNKAIDVAYDADEESKKSFALATEVKDTWDSIFTQENEKWEV